MEMMLKRFLKYLIGTPKRIITKVREMISHSNKIDALQPYVELGNTLIKIKEDRRKLILLLNASTDNSERREINKLLNKVDRQLNEHLQDK
jgi:hypothetical protein